MCADGGQQIENMNVVYCSIRVRVQRCKQRKQMAVVTGCCISVNVSVNV